MKLLEKNIKIVFLYLIFVAFYSCDRNSAEPKDCLGVEGGSAILDQCGVCNGNNSTCSDDGGNPDGGDDGSSDGSNLECFEGYTYSSQTSICTPDQFLHNSSTQQAAYFFSSVTFNGEYLDENDWVGAFNGDVCVGARKWDITQCGSDICELPVLGYDGNLTLGYMSEGEFPIFKVFIASDLTYHEVYASEEIPWANFMIDVIDSLSECENGAQFCDK